MQQFFFYWEINLNILHTFSLIIDCFEMVLFLHLPPDVLSLTYKSTIIIITIIISIIS